MTVDQGSWVELAQVVQQVEHGGLLLEGARVLRLLVAAIHATNVTDTDAVGVVTLAVGTADVDVAARLDVAISIHHVMVANVGPALLLVPSANVGHGVVLAFRRRRAMNDNFSDCAL